MTEPAPTPPAADSWDAILDGWRRRYPGQKDSVLFCVHKLEQNPDLSLRDFRDEARLHGIPVAGRSLHSARVLLGLAKPTTAAAEPAEAEAAVASPRRRAPRAAAADDDADSIEDQVVAAVRRMQSAALSDGQKLRTAIRQAVAILQRALDDA